MPRRTYLCYSAVGGVAWAAGLTALGYGLGKVPFVRDHVQPHLDLVILALVVATLVPIGIHVLRGRLAAFVSTSAAAGAQQHAPVGQR
ncbi:MAG: hypothetical protein H0V13_05585, partial [Nocardioidaceae bacterium]|nr:hypothetical protein [Nocardioidaceae bacterium]